MVDKVDGGGEYGEEWHKAGTILKKQNVFDDFIGAAEYLMKTGYTSPAMVLGLKLLRAQNSSRKYSASSWISWGRSRSAGTRMGTTLTR